ncbi:unnamed protein product [Phytomonas sp. EM1]|nr:unnamed protein product [Phytomonas sp. EM1]|eukprot:CCW60168.1 unnamed protein product [Phytomonas sp. isolate EM1]
MATDVESPPEVNDAVTSVAGAIRNAIPIRVDPPSHANGQAVSSSSVVLTKYASYDELRRARLRKDPHIALRRELEALQKVPKPRDDFAVLSDAIIEGILRCYEATAPAVVQLAATCHRLRRLSLSLVVLEGVCVVPEMIPYARLASLDRVVRGSLMQYLGNPGRRARMRRLGLVNLKQFPPLLTKSALPWLNPIAALQLVAQLPHLSFLDLRGVRWRRSAETSLGLQHFLEDLHLVAPSLAVLKVDAELLGSWAAGWWHWHPHLHTLVVGSRAGEGARQAAPAITLPADLFTMLGGPDGGLPRRWTLKVWDPLSVESLKQLLMPDEPLSQLQVLLVNFLGNCASVEGKERTARVFSDAILIDTMQSKTSKTKRATSPGMEAADPVLFPSLESITIVEVEEYSLVAVGVFARLLVTAPNLVNFNICNPIRVPSSNGAKDKSKESQI